MRGGRGQLVGTDLPYRSCVGVMLLNKAGQVFIGRRRFEPSPHDAAAAYAWQMPQGGIDPGEEPYQAALRELYEETSVRSVKPLAEAPEWYSYDLPAVVGGRAWRGRYRGQTQRWFAFRFEGNEDEINVQQPGGGRHKPEFDEWRWEAMERLPDLIIPFKRPVYENVVAAFSAVAELARQD